MNEREIDEKATDQTHVIKRVKVLHDEPTPQRGAVKFDFMTSLQNIVMAKIVGNLWTNQDTQQEIVKLIHRDIRKVLDVSSDKWHEVENIVAAKISQFSLPHFISSRLTYIVPAVGKSIFEFIRHHDERILNTCGYSQHSFVNLIGNITWTARGKIDYAQTARNILANQDICLSEDTKFKLACSYCLEDEIALLSPNVVNKYYLDKLDIEMHPMVYFWITHITGNNSKLNNPLYFDYNSQNRSMIINELFQKVIKYDKWNKITCNEVAITFVWNKLSAEEKAKNITSLIQKLDDQNLKYTLLSNIDYEQQQDIFKECSHSILIGILKDWSWEEYFLPTALHFLDGMKPSHFLYILDEVTMGKIKNFQKENKFMYNQYKSIFRELWNVCHRNLKDFVFEHENRYFLSDFLISLSCKENMDIICLILNDLNIQQRKDMLSEFYGKECCYYFILNEMWDVLELFNNPSFFSENDIIQFKQAIVIKEGHSIAVHFLKQNALDNIEHFMSWAFKSQEEIDQFRKSLSHVVICDTTLKSIITHNTVDFIELDNHFKWCAKGDLKVINEFKAKVPKSFHDKFLSHLIENDRYDLFEKVLNWCFLDDQQKILQFKSNIYKDDDLAECIISMTVNLIKKYNSFTMLERFLGWCFCNEQEIKEFKIWLLNPLEILCSVCAKLLCQHNLVLADKFINWCITSSEEVCLYKNTFMISNHYMGFILHFFGNKKDLQLLIEWFNPSKDTLQKFHTQLLEGNVKLNPRLYKLLREVIKSTIFLKKQQRKCLIKNTKK